MKANPRDRTSWIHTGKAYCGECDRCHAETLVFVFIDENEDSGEWDYCAGCAVKLRLEMTED